MARMLFEIRLSKSLYYLLLTFAIILIFEYASQGSAACQGYRVTISASKIPLMEVFNKIRRQTGLYIKNDFRETNLNEKTLVSVNFTQADINQVMIFLLSDKKDLTFNINNHTIVIRRLSPVLPENSLNLLNGKKLDTVSTTFSISGKIVDSSAAPIPGVSIRIKNTRKGTISNADGSFLLSEVNKGDIITITSLGFESKEVPVGNSPLYIKLNPYTNTLDEKVVIAYGSTTRRLNTGNISSIKAIDIEKQPVTNALLTIQGRVPGVTIQQSSGLPGSGVTIRIQGINSLNSGNDPFFVVDGVPYISQLLPTNNPVSGTSGVPNVAGNPLNYINTSDIESIEVLKDADATAIYGSRAANGAVLITTKKGKTGDLRTDITLQNGRGSVGHKLKVLNTNEYLAMRHEALKNDGIASPSQYDYDLNGTWDTTRNIDWQKELIGRTAQYTNAQVSVSGGSNLTQFLVAAGYHKESTVFPGSFSDTKGSLHFNVNSASANKRFKILLSGSFMQDNNRLPRTDLTLSAITLAPVAPNPVNPDGSINWAPDSTGATTYYVNPLAPLFNDNSVNKTDNLTSNSIISYELIPGLTLKSSLGYNILTTNETYKTTLSWIAPEYRPYLLRTTQFLNNRIMSWLVEPQIEYKRNIGKGNLNALVGSTISQQNSIQQNTVAAGFNNDLLMEDLASAPLVFGSSINSTYKYNALYGRLTYNWQDQYILNLTARRDGSSRFGPQNQFHNFAAIGAAWIFSQTSFIKDKFPILSFGKLRGSYGTTGNDQIGDYQFLDLYQSTLVTGPSYQNALGLLPSRITNPSLQWEETKKIQFGIELGFIKDRILFTVNYNHNRSSNQLVPSPLPSITGFGNIIMNFPAVIQNTGWEFTLNTTNFQTKHFTWTTNINLTIPKNQLLSYFGIDKNNSIAIGKPLSVTQLFHFAGTNDTIGSYQFLDRKGNITAQPSDPDDRTVIVNSDPKFYGGLQNSLRYKGFMLDFLIQFIKQEGFDYISSGIRSTIPGNFNHGQGNQSTVILDHWQKPGDHSTYQAFSSNFSRYNSFSLMQKSDAVWVDASFIKFKNISISWQLPDSWDKAIHFKNLRVFTNMQNVFTITNYKGLDPETRGNGLPPLQVITFGLQATL